MKLQKMLITMVFAFAATAVLQLAALGNQEPAVRYSASWVASPNSLEEAARLSESIVLGRVVEVAPADDLVVRVPEEPEGVDRVPTEVVVFEVEDVFKGDTPGTEFIFHTGLSGENVRDEEAREQAAERARKPVEDEGRAVILEDDPPYEQGELYVLFLTKGPESKVGERAIRTVRAISPEGRYLITDNRTVEPVTDRKFAGELRGMSLEEFARLIKEAASKTGRQ
ncbi:MAG: hypothetical protein ACE5LU_10385 [Anaerolineae bacterium]